MVGGDDEGDGAGVPGEGWAVGLVVVIGGSKVGGGFVVGKLPEQLSISPQITSH